MADGIYAVYQYRSPRYAIVRGDILLEVTTTLKKAKTICPDGTVGVEIVNIRLRGGDRRVADRQATCKFDIHTITEAELEAIRERNRIKRFDLDYLDYFEVQEDPPEDLHEGKEASDDVEA